jgi:hypothetical protein
MNERPRDSRQWYGLAWAAMVGTLCVWGMLANRLTLVQALATIGVGAALLGGAALWRWTLERAAQEPPMGWRGWLWGIAEFVGWLALLAALGWWQLGSGQD